MYVVTVIFEILPECVDEFSLAMEKQARTSLNVEPGCLQFDVCYAIGKPEQCFLYEIYSDKATFDEHLNSAHFLEFSSLIENWIHQKTVSCYKRAWPKEQK